MSTATVTLESPLADPESDSYQFYEKANIIFTVIFVLEAIIKIVAFGFVNNGKTSYLRISWNQLDFFIVIISVIELFFSQNEGLSIVKVFRTLRILRPIRIITRN